MQSVRPIQITLILGCLLAICFGFGPTAIADNDTTVFDIDKVDAYLADPFHVLADALAASGRDREATVCRNWIPQRQADSTIGYFSSVRRGWAEPGAIDQAVSQAFEKARVESAARALRGARRAAEEGQAPLAMELLWRSVREDPARSDARNILGLPPGNSSRFTIRLGGESPAKLGWPPRSFFVAQSQHFRLFSTAPRRETSQLIQDLERFYELWSQWFFRHWTTDEELCQQIAAGKKIGIPEVVCDVVLFGDRDAYIRGVGGDNPAVDQSTGFYSPENRLTLLFAGEDSDLETRYHELTHQLLQQSVPDVVASPGDLGGFWIVEGIASYVESIQIFDSYASVGGWQAPRLQHARYRWLQGQPPPAFDSIVSDGRSAFQNHEDLAALYTTIAAYTHLLIDNPETRRDAMRYLASVYQGRNAVDLLPASLTKSDSAKRLIEYLQFTAGLPDPPRTESRLRKLCLGRTMATETWLATIPPQPELVWLDLANLKIGSSDVQRLLGNGNRLRDLNLENTLVDAALGPLLESNREIEELDLSNTSLGDKTIDSIRAARSLKTLWLTGSQITDASIPVFLGLPNLESLDVQRTGVTEAGLEQLRRVRPELRLNPLQIRTQ
jgi:hypothetical protein